MSQLLLVEDQDIVLKGLQLWLSDSYPNIVTCKDPSEVLSIYAQEKPSSVILDIRFKGYQTTGMDICRSLLVLDPNARIIILSQYDQFAAIDSCMRAGAMAYVNKADDVEEISKAIEAVLEGRFYYSTSIQATLDGGNNKKQFDSYAALGSKSKKILNALVAGHTQKSIALVFGISRSNYYHHLHGLFEAFSVNSVQDLIKEVTALGIVLDSDLFS